MAHRDASRGLLGRRSECESLDRLLQGVRAGQSRVLVLRGEAGIGKTALLEYTAARASGCRIARADRRSGQDPASGSGWRPGAYDTWIVAVIDGWMVQW